MSNIFGTFTTSADTVNPPLGRDTEILLYLKEDQLEYLEKKIRDIISYPTRADEGGREGLSSHLVSFFSSVLIFLIGGRR